MTETGNKQPRTSQQKDGQDSHSATAGGLLDAGRELAAGAVARAQELAGDAGAVTTETLGQAAAALSDGFSSGKEYLAEQGFTGLGKEVAGLVKRYPVPSFLLGIGIGVVIGRTLSRE